MKEIKTIGIVGAGQMGTGIAQVAATAGYQVAVYDAFPGVAEKSLGRIKASLEKLVSKGKLEQSSCDTTLGSLTTVDSLEELAKSDLVIEAAIEKADLKMEIFSTLDKAAGPDTILASNTSSISLTELASSTKRPDRVIGTHFFNPAPVMKLLELVKGYSTSQETIDTLLEVGRRMNKITIVALDKPGFIVNRMIDLMINEAICLVEEGVGTVEDIDNGMKYGCNHPMGPLALADMIGLDVMLAVLEVFYQEYGDMRYRPAPLLRKMVRAGKLGRKTGEGFYKYE